MENYQKIEKIGEGELLALLCLTFSERRINTMLNWHIITAPGESFADYNDQGHTVLSTKLATLHIQVELSHSRRFDLKLKTRACPVQPFERSPFSRR
jgi:hypothetical protein